MHRFAREPDAPDVRADGDRCGHQQCAEQPPALALQPCADLLAVHRGDGAVQDEELIRDERRVVVPPVGRDGCGRIPMRDGRGHGELQHQADTEKRDVVPGGCAQQPDHQREDQVDLQHHEQEVHLEPGEPPAELVEEVGQARRDLGEPARQPHVDHPIDGRPDHVWIDHQLDSTLPERRRTEILLVEVLVHQHEAGEGEERVAREMQQQRRGVHRHAGELVGGLREAVHEDDQRERHTADQVDLVQVGAARRSRGRGVGTCRRLVCTRNQRRRHTQTQPLTVLVDGVRGRISSR
ncbi:Uncharacterised protein [Mycobacteroides abscessus subsp. abscessus]|nr:Uncharacterised protein [Mycobacteroides abscessus subsp. abscessus]